MSAEIVILPAVRVERDDAALRRFEAASGIKLAEEKEPGRAGYAYLTTEDGRHVGAMVKAIADTSLASGWSGLPALQKSLETAAADVAKARAALGIEDAPKLSDFAKGRGRAA